DVWFRCQDGGAAPAAMQHEHLILFDEFLHDGLSLLRIAAVVLDYKLDFPAVYASALVKVFIDRGDTIHDLSKGTGGTGDRPEEPDLDFVPGYSRSIGRCRRPERKEECACK